MRRNPVCRSRLFRVTIYGQEFVIMMIREVKWFSISISVKTSSPSSPRGFSSYLVLNLLLVKNFGSF